MDFDETMAYGADQYRDVIEHLNRAGLPATFTQTGGLNAAIEVRLDGGQTVLVTEADDSLAWHRADHRSWGVGVYPRDSEYDDGPLAWQDSDGGDMHLLLPLVAKVLREVARPTSTDRQGPELG